MQNNNWVPRHQSTYQSINYLVNQFFIDNKQTNRCSNSDFWQHKTGRRARVYVRHSTSNRQCTINKKQYNLCKFRRWTKRYAIILVELIGCSLLKRSLTLFQIVIISLLTIFTCALYVGVEWKYKQDAQLSQRDRAAGCVIVFAKSRRLERMLFPISD